MTTGTTRSTMLGGAALVALATGIATAASAQDFCGGASANGQWIGGAEGASDVSIAAAPLEQMALVLMQNEYVALFSVSAATEVRVEAQGRGAGDTIIDLRDEAGEIVVSDDDSGGGGASRAEIGLEPGRYCLSVKSFDGSPMTGFVRVGRTDQEALTAGLETPPDDGGEMPIDEMPIDPGVGVCEVATVARSLGAIDADLAAGGVSDTASVNDVPSWGFTLDTAAAVSITAQNEDADPLITLYDEYGSYLSENDDFDGLNSRLDMAQPLAAGSYCIAMQALTDPSLPITVAIAAYDADAALMGQYDRGEASPPLDGSYPVTGLGLLGNRLREDIQSTETASWFSFEVDQAGLVLIEAVTNGMGDPSVMLFDDFGRQIAYNDDTGETLDSMVTARVQPGTYVVAVRQLGEGTQVLTRLLFERYVAAQ